MDYVDRIRLRRDGGYADSEICAEESHQAEVIKYTSAYVTVQTLGEKTRLPISRCFTNPKAAEMACEEAANELIAKLNGFIRTLKEPVEAEKRVYGVWGNDLPE